MRGPSGTWRWGATPSCHWLVVESQTIPAPHRADGLHRRWRLGRQRLVGLSGLMLASLANKTIQRDSDRAVCVCTCVQETECWPYCAILGG